MDWRLIIGEGNVYWNMALDEAILLLREEDKIENTLRLYVFNPSGVTFGYFQKIFESINIDFLKKNNIGFTRRITGGGAVYHDANGEITYSIIADIKFFPTDIVESFRKICSGLIETIKMFGLNAEFKPINDIIVNGRKVSGSAQTRKRKTLLQHGTLMYNTNLDILARSLIVSKEKLIAHGVKTIYERVTTISRELGYKVSKENVIETMVKGFEKALKINLYRDNLSKNEKELAKKLLSKYMSKEWIYRR